MISAFVSVVAIIACVISIACLIAVKKQLDKLTPVATKYNDLKEDHDELKIAYDNLSDKYYQLMEENTDLERKIDEYEEQILSNQIEKDLNED